MSISLKELLDDIAISLTLFFHNCKTLIDITEWPKETDININSHMILQQRINIADPNLDPQKEFEKFKSFIEGFREHTNSFYGNKIFNLAEYYIWSMREHNSDDIVLIDIWEKARLITKKRGSKNHWEIKEPKHAPSKGDLSIVGSNTKRRKRTPIYRCER